MQNAKTSISVHELIHDVVPKLKATEKIVGDTLLAMLETVGVIDAVDDGPGAILQLDQHESLAIENARRLYERVQAIQTA